MGGGSNGKINKTQDKYLVEMNKGSRTQIKDAGEKRPIFR